ncbi:unnamed protein product [Caretta caretta]
MRVGGGVRACSPLTPKTGFSHNTLPPLKVSGGGALGLWPPGVTRRRGGRHKALRRTGEAAAGGLSLLLLSWAFGRVAGVQRPCKAAAAGHARRLALARPGAVGKGGGGAERTGERCSTADVYSAWLLRARPWRRRRETGHCCSIAGLGQERSCCKQKATSPPGIASSFCRGHFVTPERTGAPSTQLASWALHAQTLFLFWCFANDLVLLSSPRLPHAPSFNRIKSELQFKGVNEHIALLISWSRQKGKYISCHFQFWDRN